jgi:hypothetical protein
MTDHERVGEPVRAGSVVWGLLQSLLLYVAGGVLALRLLGGGSHGSQAVVAGVFVGSLALAAWHGVRGRSRTSIGVALGTLLWLAAGFLLVAWAVQQMFAHATIPW